MDSVRPVKITFRAPSVSRLIPNDRYCLSLNRRELTARDSDPIDDYLVTLTHTIRVITGSTVDGYGVNDQFVQNAVTLTRDVDTNDHAFSVGYGSFSIPLIVTSNRNEAHFTAYQLLSREGLLDATEEGYARRRTSVSALPEYNTQRMPPGEMGFTFNRGTVFLNLNKLVFDERRKGDNFTINGLRIMPVVENTQPSLDWVSPTTAVREPMDSIWDMMKVTHLIEQSKGTLAKWFKGAKRYLHGVKHTKRGYLRLEIDSKEANAFVVNTEEEQTIANINTVTREENDDWLAHSENVQSTGYLDYHTYEKWIGSKKSIDMSIGRMMGPTDSELIGVDTDGRFLFGMATESGTQCVITMNSVQKSPPRIGAHAVSEEIADDPYYRKWVAFGTEFCEARNYEVDVSLEKMFTIYINSGLLTQDDVDAYNRLK